MSKISRNCDNCGKPYMADSRNLKRGWGLCCSKSCAAKKREMSKPGYNPKRVEKNNERRANWMNTYYNGLYGEHYYEDQFDECYYDNKD